MLIQQMKPTQPLRMKNRATQIHKSFSHIRAVTTTKSSRMKNRNIQVPHSPSHIFFKTGVMPFLIINIFNITGTYLLVFYAVDILSYIKTPSVNHLPEAILIVASKFVMSIISTIFLVITGRKRLSIVSGIGTTISTFCLCIFLLNDSMSNVYLMVIFTMIYITTDSVIYMILPGIMLNEIFPSKICGLILALIFMCLNTALFFTAKVFPLFNPTSQISEVFCLFIAASLLASLLLYFLLPNDNSSILCVIMKVQKHNKPAMQRKKLMLNIYTVV